MRERSVRLQKGPAWRITTHNKHWYSCSDSKTFGKKYYSWHDFSSSNEMKAVTNLSLITVQSYITSYLQFLLVLLLLLYHSWGIAKFLLTTVFPSLVFVPHLDEGVESLAIHLQELLLNVQHVNLRPGDHYSDEHTICGAQPLTRERSCGYTALNFASACFDHIHYDDMLLFLWLI